MVLHAMKEGVGKEIQTQFDAACSNERNNTQQKLSRNP